MNTQSLEEKLRDALRILMAGRPSAVRFVQFEKKHEQQRELSRQLKQDVRAELLRQGAEPKWVKTSLSHTHSANFHGILVIGSDHSVGVDLEHTERKVHPRVGPRITHPNEEKFGLQVLEYWVMKEAAFKATPQNAETYLPQYVLMQWDPLTQEGDIQLLPRGTSCRVKLLTIGLWTVAFAHSLSEK